MLINEVQYKVGLSKKSIRYYEEEGLLTPKRNTNNDYREYNESDIKDLKTIKFLRSINVPISDIKKLKSKELLLSECMQDRINKINEEEKNFKTIKNMCKEIIDNDITFDKLDVDKYYEAINILNKKGFTMKETNKNYKKDIMGAVVSSILFSILFIFFDILFTYIKLMDDTFPTLLYVFFLIFFSIPIVGIIINLIKRIKEIKGGEEYEARKY